MHSKNKCSVNSKETNLALFGLLRNGKNVSVCVMRAQSDFEDSQGAMKVSY